MSKLTVDPLSLERVLAAADYPHLHALSLINFPEKLLLSQLKGIEGNSSNNFIAKWFKYFRWYCTCSSSWWTIRIFINIIHQNNNKDRFTFKKRESSQSALVDHFPKSLFDFLSLEGTSQTQMFFIINGFGYVLLWRTNSSTTSSPVQSGRIDIVFFGI